MRPIRVAVVTEAEDDDTIARAIVAHVRGVQVDPVVVPSLRERGPRAVVRQIPQVVRTVYFNTDADALVMLVDNDLAVPHDPHTHGTTAHPGCRLCERTAAIQRALAGITPVAGRALLHTAVGCAIPAVEAWLLAGARPEGAEAAWLQRGGNVGAGALAYKRKLKELAYGAVQRRVDRPARALEHLARIFAAPDLLRTAFPGGYAPLEDAIRAWPL